MHSIYPDRCKRCYMRNEVCICELIPNIQTKTRLTVVMHVRESYKTTNSGRIACLSLSNSEIHLRGLKGEPLSCEKILDPDYQPLLLTLSDKSTVLSKEYIKSFNRPIQLIVPDGNWRQASKMGKRDPALKAIPWVKLPENAVVPRDRMRKEHLVEGMSTLEAIARAFGVIENSQIETTLDNLYLEMSKRTLSTRPRARIISTQQSDT